MNFAEILTTVGTAPWVPLVVLVFCLLDGFFPPVPSETAVIAAVTLGLASGGDPLFLTAVLVAAAIGAAAGDSIAYAIGRAGGTDRWAWMRRPRVQTALDWAGARMVARPALLILTARYIPIGRVAVNMTAGATRLPYRRFLPISIVGAVLWSAMCLLLSVLAATWFGHSPLLAAGVGIVLSLVLGLGVDAVARLRERRAARLGVTLSRTPDSASAAASPVARGQRV